MSSLFKGTVLTQGMFRKHRECSANLTYLNNTLIGLFVFKGRVSPELTSTLVGGSGAISLL